jgi:hypothetical protein
MEVSITLRNFNTVTMPWQRFIIMTRLQIIFQDGRRELHNFYNSPIKMQDIDEWGEKHKGDLAFSLLRTLQWKY